MLVPTIELIRLMAAAENLNHGGGSAVGPLVGRKIALFVALTAQPSNNSLWADLTEATYTGYARADATWSGPFDTGSGSALVSNSTTWSPTDGASPQSILGYALVTTDTPPHLLALELFPAPIPFVGPVDGFVLTCQAGLLSLGTLGNAAILS